MAIQPPQRFELDDLAHVEREARTIYAPGATPGDVLVVQSDHSLVAAPGGGSSPFTGWTQDDADPANVNSNGGNLDLSAEGEAPLLNLGQGSVVSATGSLQTSLISEGLGVADYSDANYTVAFIKCGKADPSAGGGVTVGKGSLYLRDTGTGGEVWLKTGPNATDWRQLALVP